MKAEIMGFDQKVACNLGLDLTDLLILRGIVHLYPQQKHTLHDEENYYQLISNNLMHALPILGMTRASLEQKIKDLEDRGILEWFSIQYEDGNLIWGCNLRMTDKSMSLLTSTKDI